MRGALYFNPPFFLFFPFGEGPDPPPLIGRSLLFFSPLFFVSRCPLFFPFSLKKKRRILKGSAFPFFFFFFRPAPPFSQHSSPTSSATRPPPAHQGILFSFFLWFFFFFFPWLSRLSFPFFTSETCRGAHLRPFSPLDRRAQSGSPFSLPHAVDFAAVESVWQTLSSFFFFFFRL